jgi:hypothetical protein
MAMRSQAGPMERDSGRARRSPATAMRARAAGQRGSLYLAVVPGEAFVVTTTSLMESWSWE